MANHQPTPRLDLGPNTEELLQARDTVFLIEGVASDLIAAHQDLSEIYMHDGKQVQAVAFIGQSILSGGALPHRGVRLGYSYAYTTEDVDRGKTTFGLIIPNLPIKSLNPAERIPLDKTAYQFTTPMEDYSSWMRKYDFRHTDPVHRYSGSFRLDDVLPRPLGAPTVDGERTDRPEDRLKQGILAIGKSRPLKPMTRRLHVDYQI